MVNLGTVKIVKKFPILYNKRKYYKYTLLGIKEVWKQHHLGFTHLTVRRYFQCPIVMISTNHYTQDIALKTNA